jgi:hypothetical protein
VISLRLLKYIGVAFGGCLLFKLFAAFQATPFGVIEYVLSTAFGIAFHLLVIVRLPVFRTFYRARAESWNRSPRSFADLQAAPPLSLLLAGGVAALLWQVVSGADVWQFGFCAGLAAGIMSFYSMHP